MFIKTPWDQPEEFEKLLLRDVVARGVNCDRLNLWDGNVCWVSKSISPIQSVGDKVVCLYSGVTTRTYSSDQVVYLLKEVKQA